MHILLNNGVANLEIACLVKAMKPFGITLQHVRDYVSHFVLPSKHGKVESTWLSEKRFGKQMANLQSFAGTLLSLA